MWIPIGMQAGSIQCSSQSFANSCVSYLYEFLLLFVFRSRMRFSSKIAPALNVADMKPKVLYCFDEGSTVSETGFTDWHSFVHHI